MCNTVPKPADPLRSLLFFYLGSQERRSALARTIALSIQVTDDAAKHGGNFNVADDLLANEQID
jgi:hypothetical protein